MHVRSNRPGPLPLWGVAGISPPPLWSFRAFRGLLWHSTPKDLCWQSVPRPRRLRPRRLIPGMFASERCCVFP
jgi:hypothetical protein